MLTFRGSKVFETRPFDIDFINEPRDLLSRERQVGEYFIMKDKNIKIYSMDEDDFVEISYATAKAAADEAAKDADGKQNIKDQDQDYIVLVRPFQTYLMASGILMKGGLDTGMTAYGHMDFQLTDNVISKTHIGHFTMYHKVLSSSLRMWRLSKISSRRGTSAREQRFMQSHRTSRTTWQRTASRKTSLHSGLERRRMPMAKKRIAKVENPIDLTGYYDAETLDASNTDLDVEKTYDSCDAVAQNYGLEAFARTATRTATSCRLCQLNTVCFQGMQLDQDAKNQFTVITQNTGHWGPNVYPGVRAVRKRRERLHAPDGLPQDVPEPRSK